MPSGYAASLRASQEGGAILGCRKAGFSLGFCARLGPQQVGWRLRALDASAVFCSSLQGTHFLALSGLFSAALKTKSPPLQPLPNRSSSPIQLKVIIGCWSFCFRCWSFWPTHISQTCRAPQFRDCSPLNLIDAAPQLSAPDRYAQRSKAQRSSPSFSFSAVVLGCPAAPGSQGPSSCNAGSDSDAHPKSRCRHLPFSLLSPASFFAGSCTRGLLQSDQRKMPCLRVLRWYLAPGHLHQSMQILLRRGPVDVAVCSDITLGSPAALREGTHMTREHGHSSCTMMMLAPAASP